MASEFHIKSTSDSIRKSFIDFDLQNYPQYTQEQVEQALEKGEKTSFFTKSHLEILRKEILKGEASKEDIEKITNQLKELEPITIQKGELDYEVGFFYTEKESE